MQRAGAIELGASGYFVDCTSFSFCPSASTYPSSAASAPCQRSLRSRHHKRAGWERSPFRVGGSDELDGGEGNDFLFGGTEVGAVSVNLPTNGFFSVPAHYFSITADSSSDVLRGGSGYDTIIAGYGDTVDGGADRAVLHFSYLGAPQCLTEGGGDGWVHITERRPATANHGGGSAFRGPTSPPY